MKMMKCRMDGLLWLFPPHGLRRMPGAGCFLVRLCKALADKMNWMRGVSPNWFEFVGTAFGIVLYRVTPWYRARNDMICTWYNANGTKLLSSGRTYATVRARGGSEIVYYDLVCNFLRAKMVRRRLVDSNGETHNAFLAWLGVYDEKNDPLEWKSDVVLRGWCFTRKQCERFLDRCRDAAPDMEWIDEAPDMGWVEE